MSFIHKMPPAGSLCSHEGGCASPPPTCAHKAKTKRIGLHVVAAQTVLSVVRLAPLTQTTVPRKIPVHFQVDLCWRAHICTWLWYIYNYEEITAVNFGVS